MKKGVFLAMLVLYSEAIASTAHWDGINAYSEHEAEGRMFYSFGGNIHDGKGSSALILSHMFCHVDNGGIYMKHMDYSLESMEPTFNW